MEIVDFEVEYLYPVIAEMAHFTVIRDRDTFVLECN